MALTRIRLNTQQAEDFSVLADLGPDRLQSVIAILKGIDRQLLASAELRELVTTAIGDHNARALVRQLVGFGIGIRRKAFTIDVVNAISQALREQDIPPATVDKWERVRGIFKDLLADERIANLAKSLDLSFDYANLFHGVRLITDSRPVFDDAHLIVIGNIVRHILRLSYTSVDGRMTTLSLAIDRKEIEELNASCDEALKKEAALAKYFADPHATMKITPGDERDDLS